MSTLDDRTTELLARPSLAGLSYALRHSETWPEGFEFDFGYCHTCAMGLAFQTWFAGVEKEPGRYFGNATKGWTKWAARVFGIPYDDARILFAVGCYGGDLCPHIVAHIVAYRIDAYLATRKESACP